MQIHYNYVWRNFELFRSSFLPRVRTSSLWDKIPFHYTHTHTHTHTLMHTHAHTHTHTCTHAHTRTHTHIPFPIWHFFFFLILSLEAPIRCLHHSWTRGGFLGFSFYTVILLSIFLICLFYVELRCCWPSAWINVLSCHYMERQDMANKHPVL